MHSSIEYAEKEFRLSTKMRKIFYNDFAKALEVKSKTKGWTLDLPIIGMVCEKIIKTDNEKDKVLIPIEDIDGSDGGYIKVRGWAED